MRIVTLNIQSGGSHPRISFLWDFLLALKPDCIILTEYTSSNAVGQWLREHALGGGFPYVGHTIRDTPKSRGVLIAANLPFEAFENPANLDVHGERLLRATFDHFVLYGIYLPQGIEKEPLLKHLRDEAYQKPLDQIICIGDFNTCRHDLDVERSAKQPRPVFESPSFRSFELSWTDAWRHMHPGRSEFSWYSTTSGGSRRGFRIDHCFVSAPLVSRIQSASYDHLPRLEKTTDHSALIVDIDL